MILEQMGSGRNKRECRRVRRLLSDRLDRPLDDSEVRRLAEHLPGCPACAAFERRLGSGMRALAALPGKPGNPRVREAVLREASRPSRAWLGQGLKLAGGIAAFALVGLLLAAVLRPSGGGGGKSAGLHGGSGPGDVAAATPSGGWAPYPTQAASLACAKSLLTSVEQATSLSSTQNGLVVWFQVTLDPALCATPNVATVNLTAQDGSPLAIEGNGLMVDLVAGDVANTYRAGVLWLNWCGDPDSFGLVVELGDAALNAPIKDTPGCDDPNQPAKLGQAPALEPTPVWGDDNQPACDRTTLVTDIEATADGPDGVRVITLKQTSEAVGCAFDASYTVWLQDSDGTPLDIAGNGLTVRLAATAADSVAIATLTWANWCGDPGPSQIAVEGSSSSSGAGPVIPPACTADGEPSRLALQPPDALPANEPPAPPDALPACPEDQLTYLIDTEGVEGARYITILVAGPGKVECVVDEHPTVTILDASGTPLDMPGNGLVAPLNGPEPAVIATWVSWTNWCAGAGTFQAVISGEAGTTTVQVDSPPCLDSTRPTELAITGSPHPLPAPTAGSNDPLPPTPTPSAVVELPACAAGDYQLTLNGGGGVTGGQIWFGVSATSQGMPCRIGGVALSLRDARGAPLDVDGNGASVPLVAWPAGYAPTATFQWGNWCGAASEVVAVAIASDGTATTLAVDPLPGCQSSANRSSLVASPGS